MEGAITSFAVEKLGELIISEAKLLSGVKVQMDQLRTELTRMQGFLQKVDSRRGEDPTVINYIVEIRGVSYDAEDIIETYILKVQSRRGGGALKFLKRCASILSEGAVLHKIGMDIKSLNNTITDITRSAKTYGIDLTRDEEVSSSNYDKQIELKQSYGHVEEEGIVGLQNDVQKLSRLLVHSENHIAIWGMGGLGKTTLAKKLYQDGLVRSHFDCFAWTCISQNWQIKDVLQALLIQFKSPSISSAEKTEIYRMRTEELAQQLYELQEKNMCLVVLDDVWSAEALGSISAAFPERTRSKIVLTTRIRDVAQGIRVHMHEQVVIHDLQLLGQAESMELLWKKALSRNCSTGMHSPLMEEIGREIVIHCKGLPLAIVVLGGLLSQMETLEDWKKVLVDIPSYLSEGGGGVMQVLAFSYWNLPYYLKPCFLYLGQYQEDAEINVESLVRKWVAEGIVSSKHRGQKTLVEVARGYVNELAGRCMVQLIQTKYTQRIKYCRLHDLVREFCLIKLDELDFLKILDFRAGSSPARNTASKVRRLAIYMDDAYDIDKDRYIKDCTGSYPHLRSISYSIEGYVRNSERLLEGLEMLRTLIINGGFSRLPKVVGRLLHLRYLSLRKSWISKLPSSIGNLRCLQTLDLRVDRFKLLIIPNVLWKMEQLTHLYLPRMMKSGDHPKLLRLDTLGKLETLINFNTKHASVNCMSKLDNLQKLRAVFNHNEDLNVILHSPCVVKNQLQRSSLSLKWDTTTEETQAQVCQLLACHHLRKLEFICPFLELPRWHEFPHAIVFLWLEVTGLTEDPMPTLEKLPQLRFLRLDERSFVGNEIVCSCVSQRLESGSIRKDIVGCGFPRLLELLLFGLPNLENWKVEKGAMPNLQNINIIGCRKLKQVPEELRYITTLMSLRVIDMGREFNDMLKEGGRDFHKVQHIPQVVFK